MKICHLKNAIAIISIGFFPQLGLNRPAQPYPFAAFKFNLKQIVLISIQYSNIHKCKLCLRFLQIDGLILSEHKLKTHMSAMIKFMMFVVALFVFLCYWNRHFVQISGKVILETIWTSFEVGMSVEC